jgi:membrane protein YdbS with pleckstrin-like domain
MTSPREAAAAALASQHHTTVREAAAELFWFWVLSVLALTGALVVVAGFIVLAESGVQIVLSVLLILALAHAWNQHRHRYELRRDPRFRYARERRGF